MAENVCIWSVTQYGDANHLSDWKLHQRTRQWLPCLYDPRARHEKLCIPVCVIFFLCMYAANWPRWRRMGFLGWHANKTHSGLGYQFQVNPLQHLTEQQRNPIQPKARFHSGSQPEACARSAYHLLMIPSWNNDPHYTSVPGITKNSISWSAAKTTSTLCARPRSHFNNKFYLRVKQHVKQVFMCIYI